MSTIDDAAQDRISHVWLQVPTAEDLHGASLQCAAFGRDVAERATFLDMLGLLPAVVEAAA